VWLDMTSCQTGAWCISNVWRCEWVILVRWRAGRWTPRQGLDAELIDCIRFWCTARQVPPVYAITSWQSRLLRSPLAYILAYASHVLNETTWEKQKPVNRKYEGWLQCWNQGHVIKGKAKDMTLEAFKVKGFIDPQGKHQWLYDAKSNAPRRLYLC